MNQNPNVHDDTPPPYDIVGDVHGCIDELLELLDRLGYRVEPGGVITHPEGRTLVFIGDLADRGPDSVAVWRLALASFGAGTALMAPGNHEAKLVRYLQGRGVKITRGLETTVRQFRTLPDEEYEELSRQIVETVLDLPSYRIFDDGRLIVAHAGIEEPMIGHVTREISIFARYGEPTGEYTALGLPIRRDWARTYRGDALVIYGHTPVIEPDWRNNTVNIDQGCCFGGALTALRYPERELVSVPARRTYADPTMTVREADRRASVPGD